MAMTRIMSFAAPTVLMTLPTNEHFNFIGKYSPSKLLYLSGLRQYQDNIRQIQVHPNTPSFIGKYNAPALNYPYWLRQLIQVPFFSLGFGPDLPYSVALGITAAGTTQGTATSLTAQDNQVTGSSASSVPYNGVIITITQQGVPTAVHNYSPNPINVYPPVGAQINNLGVNVSYLIYAGSSMDFRCLSATQYYSTSP